MCASWLNTLPPHSIYLSLLFLSCLPSIAPGAPPLSWQRPLRRLLHQLIRVLLFFRPVLRRELRLARQLLRRALPLLVWRVHRRPLPELRCGLRSIGAPTPRGSLLTDAIPRHLHHYAFLPLVHLPATAHTEPSAQRQSLQKPQNPRASPHRLAGCSSTDFCLLIPRSALH